MDRATPWGNPFLIGRDGDRATVIGRYRDHYCRVSPATKGKKCHHCTVAEFEPSRIVARVGSTRSVRLATGELVQLAPEALESILRQVRSGFISMGYEHLLMLPPIGRWVDGEITTADDGESELTLFGELLTQYRATGQVVDPFVPERPNQLGEVTISASIEAEPRNFLPEVWESAKNTAPLPVREDIKWAALPPLEWLIAVPVTWGVAQFAGGFLGESGKQLAQSLAAWLRDVSRRAKEPDRHRYVTVALELADGRRVFGFLPFGPDDDELLDVERGLTQSSTLAEVAGAQNAGLTERAHRIAYMFDGSEWRLAWFVTDEGTFRTQWYDENAPDIEQYLGRPPSLLDETGESSIG